MQDVKTYAAVTASYWGFTLSDGALRMLVLLHFHSLGYHPLDLAFLFLLYEAMGIVTNFVGGWIGARFGLNRTLFMGLGTQIIALGLLSMLQNDWAIALSVAYVMGTQALSGVAKDLTKMSSKSAIKMVVQEEGGLFRWVAFLTGSKNALKGVGFFGGGALLVSLGFQGALWAMMAALTLIFILSLFFVRNDLGRAKSGVKMRELWSRSRAVNVLSFARIFLFAARDVWFVVALPVFFAETLGWSFDEVGAFMALWVIGYGVVQAATPKLSGRKANSQGASQAALWWGLLLASTPVAMNIAMLYFPEATAFSLIAGLFLFGAAFAVNSSLHSFLIVAFSDQEKASLSVGFYYSANAVGRLLGTLLSGLVYQVAGLSACLWVSAAFIIIAAGSTLLLPNRNQRIGV